MNKLIPKHQRKSPITQQFQAKQYVSPTTGTQVVDEAVAKTKQQQDSRNIQKRRETLKKQYDYTIF